MESIDIFNDAIQEIWIHLILNLIPLIVCGVILVALSLIGLSKNLIKKSWAILLLLFSIILFAFSIYEIAIFKYDINHENFEVHYGNFSYDRISGNEKDVLRFSDKHEFFVRSVADLNIDEGEHIGYVLYGRYSRWVIAASDLPFEGFSHSKNTPDT